MATSKKSTGQKSKNLTSSVEATPVSLSVRQANGEVKKIRATCGRGLEKPLADYDPDTQSWRMFGDISLWGDCPLLASLPPSGMTRSGVLFLQPPWEQITGETELLSWPTPTTQDHIERKSTQQKPGSRHSVGLGDAVRMWPTPTAHPNNSNKNGKFPNDTLRDAVNKYPTPTARDYKGISGRSMKRDKPQCLPGAVGNGGKLNPTWVEWLMGFPLGWTDLED
jgi:DNA (cytosine-5)-methyltransferase 1